MGRRDIGRVLEGSSGSPDLRIGMTSADFHTCTNLFEENDVLTRFVISAIVIGKLSFDLLFSLEKKDLQLCSMANLSEVGNDLGLSVEWNLNFHCYFEVRSEHVPSQQFESHA